LDLFFYTESDCEKRFLVKAQFNEFRICPNKTNLSQDEEFLIDWNLELLWRIICLIFLSLIFCSLFFCSFYFNCDSTRFATLFVKSKSLKPETPKKSSKTVRFKAKAFLAVTNPSTQSIKANSNSKHLLIE
jgi:hypothetical protein